MFEFFTDRRKMPQKSPNHEHNNIKGMHAIVPQNTFFQSQMVSLPFGNCLFMS